MYQIPTCIYMALNSALCPVCCGVLFITGATILLPPLTDYVNTPLYGGVGLVGEYCSRKTRVGTQGSRAVPPSMKVEEAIDY